MTPEQVEKVRGELLQMKMLAESATFDRPGSGATACRFDHIISHVDTALAALNGEPEEVWEAYEQDNGLWRVASADGEYIAHDASHRQAARIARLPALERAAREVVQTFGGGLYLDIAVDIVGAVTALRTALDKPEA